MSAFTSLFEATSLARLGVRREERRMIKMRADALLVARGLAATRAQAQAAIEAGLARADGMAIRKPSQMLHETVALECAPAHPWVSRGGLKLTHALDAFAIDPSGLICLDVGASTGGFTDVLLARGARRVFAVDVGRGQLAEKLRNDPRVAALEETDARALSRDLVPDAVDLIVSDVSFIGLAKALPAALKLAAPSALLVALIKPQFESGPRKRETIDAEEARAIAEATGASLDGLEGFQRLGLIQSPIEGGAGALEFLYAARRA